MSIFVCLLASLLTLLHLHFYHNFQYIYADGIGKDTPNNLPPSLPPRGTWREGSPPRHRSQIGRGELDSRIPQLVPLHQGGTYGWDERGTVENAIRLSQ